MWQTVGEGHSNMLKGSATSYQTEILAKVTCPTRQGVLRQDGLDTGEIAAACLTRGEDVCYIEHVCAGTSIIDLTKGAACRDDVAAHSSKDCGSKTNRDEIIMQIFELVLLVLAGFK